MIGESFFSKNSKAALKKSPPGEWMPTIPDVCIRLNSGYPAPELVPHKELKEAVVRLLEEEQDLPLHYIGSPRLKKLRDQIRGRMAERSMVVSDEELLITSGACQGIDLIARIFLDEEAVVAIEAPTYMEALEIFQNYTNHFISIPVDEHGIKIDLLEKVLVDRKRDGQAMPRFLYTIPTFHNPTGTTLSKERREHLLALASTYDFLIVEDDAYGELAFHESPETLKAMDKEGRVLYVGSLSKIVAPGMRIGWVAGAKEFISAFGWMKKDLDHPFAHASMAAFLENTNFKLRLHTLSDTYKAKSSVMLSALEEYMPESATWFVPEGGYFVWIRIPGVDTSKMLAEAAAKGVAYIPGKHFFLDHSEGREYLRLSFSYVEEKEVIEGVKRLSRVLGTGPSSQ
ncbi:aminotransferase-like domain-containing protein [Sutcliffiella deserti]|uniref:aminotransferase-like domain-containing protein n=1 Tax=Sutcliffiella deserti TaxID=2875501 RepID=UPI001CBE9532|nr:PLP-dependent aminotransferase family protein [Sutcliffiella deserti]